MKANSEIVVCWSPSRKNQINIKK